MDWFLLALLGAFIFTIISFVDKFILERKIRDYRGVPIYSGMVSFSFSVIAWTLSGFPTLPLRDTLILMAIGALSVYAAIFYFKAMQIESTSTILVLMQIQPIMVLVLSVILLGELITVPQLIGFACIVIAAVGVSLQRAHGFQLSAALVPILIVNLLLAFTSVLFKYVVTDHDFLTVIIFESWGVVLGVVIMFLVLPNVRRAFLLSWKTLEPSAIGLVVLNEVLVLTAHNSQNLAISLGSVSLVRVVGSTQVFMGILLGWLVALWLPDVYPEDITRQGITRKLGFAAIMFVGVGMLILV